MSPYGYSVFSYDTDFAAKSFSINTSDAVVGLAVGGSSAFVTAGRTLSR